MNSRVYNVYKSCVVPLCKNTSKKHPDKLFIYVPNDKTVRIKWFNLARRDPTSLSVNTSIHFCEDHFDLPNDMENYMQYRVMGSVSQIRMKPGCLPTKFECQPDRRKRTSNSTERPYIIKKQRKALIEESVRDLEERNNSSKQFELGETSTESSGLLVKIENITEEEQQVHKTANKSIQVHITHKFRSKATQTGIIKVNQMTSRVKRNRQFVSTSPCTATRCTTIKPSTSAVQKPSTRLFTIEEQTITFTPSQVCEKDAQPGPSKILDTRNPIDSGGRPQDPLSQVVQQCRFCGEFSKDCVAVSSDMTYLAGNKTTLALNDTSVQLDFNDGSLPKTVCRDCDAKLQEFCDFVKVVKAAQRTLINVAEEKEWFGTRAEYEGTTADVEEKTEHEETETVMVKMEYDSQQEDSDGDDDKEGILDYLSVGETVYAKETHKRNSDTDTAKPKKLKAKEKCEDDLVIDIKEEVVEENANDGYGVSEVSDTGTDVKPSGGELELTTSALVFEMAGDGASEYQGYQSHR